MHADVKPTASASFLCVFPAFPLFGCNVCERETPTYLPHPGHSYFYADNGGPLVFVTPKTPFTASVCVDFYSCMRHKRKHGCGDIICGGRLHKCWSVPLFVSSHGFFFPHGAAGTWTDAALLLDDADAEPRPRLRHVTAADFLTSAFFQHANVRRGHMIFSIFMNRQ